MISLTILLDEYVDIAFNYLRRSGELDDAPAANRFLTLSVARMMRHGTLNRLVLSNKAISEYRARRPFVAQPETGGGAMMRRSKLARVQPHWHHEDPDNEEVVLLLAAAVIFTVALVALIATHG